MGDLTAQDEWYVFVVSEVTGGIFDNPPTSWLVRGWRLAYDGKYIGRHAYSITSA